ncbi:hypothetical protein [Chelatococcus asaccharovorans]|uniref:Uncharacterized protein n=1 Tax=Chelatococcus asaccharovorans TaxID=28210 RepID=A0A2V3UCF5_9HYPH|nr:hypothetical protein [Chelatococcus asaccharovorans]MBS7703289.1 hypothetical protein [Chelatococcus asaccharovorans]PXW61622.1 hypothetical protein C7450_103139 [Chelatococcus asaccharovorans]
MPFDNQKLFELAHGYAAGSFHDRGQVLTTFFMQSPAGDLVIIEAPFENDRHRGIVLNALRNSFREAGIPRYAVVSEAWIASADDGRPPVAPKDSEDRQEGVLVIAADHSGHVAGRCLIERPWDGSHPTLGPLETWNCGSGALTNLLHDSSPAEA